MELFLLGLFAAFLSVAAAVVAHVEGWKAAWVLYSPHQLPQRTNLEVLSLCKLRDSDIAILIDIRGFFWCLKLDRIPQDSWPQVGQVIQAFEATKGKYEIRVMEPHDSEVEEEVLT